MSNNNIKDLGIYGHNFYIIHTQMIAPSFLSKKSVTKAFKILDEFSFSGLKPNKEKCEVAGIGVKKEIKVALWNEKY